MLPQLLLQVILTPQLLLQVILTELREVEGRVEGPQFSDHGRQSRGDSSSSKWNQRRVSRV